jgi:hypothetical protein
MGRRLDRGIPGFRSFSTCAGCVLLLLSGCTVSRNVTLTPRSSIEQQLLVRSLERALAQIDLQQFKNRRVFVQTYGLTADREFALEFIKAHFQERGLDLVGDEKSAELHLKVFLGAFGVDRAEQLIGIPKAVAPVISVPTPEIALFKSARSHGYAEVEIFAFDEKANRFVGKTPRAIGRAKYDDYTLMLFINFNLDDLDEKPAEAGDSAS